MAIRAAVPIAAPIETTWKPAHSFGLRRFDVDLADQNNSASAVVGSPCACVSTALVGA